MQVEGRIIALQEQRFRLKTADGRVYLLTLSRGQDASALEPLLAQQRQVTVDYSGEPNLASGVAHHVTEIGS